MPWHARLSLDLAFAHSRTTARFEHDGPLRILKSLYPEGPSICHNVIVHPPGGLVGGDVLDITVRAGSGSHGLVSTPGATRFYRSDGAEAVQQVHLRVADGARLEWLPLETIAYPGCVARNALRLELEPEGECMGWDVCALGLPAAEQPFSNGRITQQVEWPGVWLERAHIDGSDIRLLDSPLGLGGHRAFGTLWLARGTPWSREERERLTDAVRCALAERHAGLVCGVTCPNPQLLLVRAVAPLVEPLMAGLQGSWATLREHAWALGHAPPRIWRV